MGQVRAGPGTPRERRPNTTWPEATGEGQTPHAQNTEPPKGPGSAGEHERPEGGQDRTRRDPYPATPERQKGQPAAGPGNRACVYLG